MTFEELKKYFEEECKKRQLDAEDYMEQFRKRFDEKQITRLEDVIAYVKELKRIEEEAHKPQKSQADRLVEYARRRAYFFIDQYEEEYARFWVNGTNATNGDTTNPFFYEKEQREEVNKEDMGTGVNAVNGVKETKARLVTMPLHSSRFKKWLAEVMYSAEKKVPGYPALKSAINVLSGQTQEDGKKYNLFNRVAPDPDENGFWIDMCDEKWRAIHVTAEGWEIIDKPPILFRRYKHQEPLATPRKVSESEQTEWVIKFLDFVNVPKDEINQLMLICVILSYFIPEIVHPILVTYGEPGSAKTWMFKLVKWLIDPSKHETLSLPWTSEALIQQLDHNYIAFYDNISYLKKWQSDELCRGATGAGTSKRELYTDDEDVIKKFKRCIGLNGINIPPQSGDLLDRSILFGLEQIDDKNRRTEKELITRFKKKLPLILGAALSILSRARVLYPKVELQGYKRLADFNQWGCAIAQALGYTVEDFENAYTNKVELQNEEALTASPMANLLLKFCMEKENLTVEEDADDTRQFYVKLTPTDLYDKVKKFAEDKLGIKWNKKYYPGDASHFMRKINEVKANLGKEGCVITERHTGTERLLYIDMKKYMETHKTEGDKTETTVDELWEKASKDSKE